METLQNMYMQVATPLGLMQIYQGQNPLGQPALTGAYFCTDKVLPAGLLQETPLLCQARQEILEYFEGKRRTFSLPLAPKGTEFQQSVWKALLNIAYGEVLSYGQLAQRIGNAKASRAVGMANNRNPLSLFIPCHRVIGANGNMVGYGGGIEKKIFMLNLEKSVLLAEQS